MKRRVFYIAGGSLLLVGIVVLLNSFNGLTGYLIFENADVSIGYYVGIWFSLVGLLLLAMRNMGNKKSHKI